MNYVIKLGDFYVKSVTPNCTDFKLIISKELMRGYDEKTAYKIANQINGEVIEITNQVTMSEEENKQLSIFDKEVQE